MENNEEGDSAPKDFECENCSFCCSLDVEITEDEIKSISRITDEDFYMKRKDRYFLRRRNSLCVFHDSENMRCTIYTFRPGVCRRFPFGKSGMSSRCKQKKDFSSRVDRRLVEMFMMDLKKKGKDTLNTDE